MNKAVNPIIKSCVFFYDLSNKEVNPKICTIIETFVVIFYYIAMFCLLCVLFG